MGKLVSDYDLEKKKELVKVFLELLGKHDTVIGAMTAAVKSPCSRYWISIEYAMRYISYAKQGKWEKVRRRPVIESIMERCNGDYSRDKIEDVIYGGAPEFFMTPLSARETIYNELKKSRCRLRLPKLP